MSDENICVYACIGVLTALYGLLALRMSFYRMAGSPGEDKPNSPLNRMYELQMLTAEWVPIGCVLGLALVQKNTMSPYYRDCLVGAFTVARLAFAGNSIARGPHLVGMVSMITCYSATLLMAGGVAFV